MKRKVSLSLLTLALSVGAALSHTRSVSSDSSARRASVTRAVRAAFNFMPPLATTLDVDRADDTATATACTPAPNDCSLRGAVTCDHPSGSFFPVGETVVTCTSPVGPTCSFTVTVTDTEAPVITTGGRRRCGRRTTST